ncbi:GTPase HflX [Paenibacillus sp. FSL H7-0326]|uniref:GTPase HflX n=1 Tax=Paenibacillus sp. FSL H7-0326 TaxID=1921144 RepID=UPI00096ED738|nr:GTPase HflX [Paenibacillus sp. FSL H7-0326]OMC67218.1 GTPase HflX [Paenibacillus sp. FSL H7-0326]
MTQPFKDKAVIVGLQMNSQEDFEHSMEELGNLANACDIELAAVLTQKAERIHPAHYIGSGKIEELSNLLKMLETTIVIFNDELSPSQVRNLEKKLDAAVLDRTTLILNIFAERARSRESQLQVELARLQYVLPRLSGISSSSGRQRGGVGTKNRGSGETKLELSQRRIEEKITELNRELELLVSQRQTQRRRRQKTEMPVVSLVGYTNTGKSSLMNAMLDRYDAANEKAVLAKDMLFATLQTSVRQISLPDRKRFLLTDTVGFVSKLPHHLVKAFRSTLEEVLESDLLLHVVDASNPDAEQLIEVTNQTLKELGADKIPVVYVYNKIDLSSELMNEIQVRKPAVFVSAKTGQGLDQLEAAIKQQLFGHYERVALNIPYDQGHLLSYFHEHANVETIHYEEDGTKLTIEASPVEVKKWSHLQAE